MDQIIDGLVSGVLVPVTDAIAAAATSGFAFLVFAVLWIAFAVSLIRSQGDLDSAWRWVRSRPLIVQGLLWLLFLPVLVGLWVWKMTWPLALRLVVITGIAGWNLLIFLPQAVAVGGR